MIENKVTKQEGSEFWDDNPCGGEWATYSQFLNWVRDTEPYIFDILDNHNCDWPNKKVLEVGCGQGTTLNYLPRYGARMFGVDMSFESLQRTKSGALELNQSHLVSVLKSDAENLPFPNSSFDIALSIGVLHHTPDTCKGIQEIYRVLKPGGTAIVMLYRSGNPKWWATRGLRGVSKIVDQITGQPNTMANWLRERSQTNSEAGTALLELFGVPVLKAFSNKQSRDMFAQYNEVNVLNYQPGFQRLIDITRLLRPLDPILSWIDNLTQNMWGFYQVIMAKK